MVATDNDTSIMTKSQLASGKRNKLTWLVILSRRDKLQQSSLYYGATFFITSRTCVKRHCKNNSLNNDNFTILNRNQ